MTDEQIAEFRRCNEAISEHRLPELARELNVLVNLITSDEETIELAARLSKALLEIQHVTKTLLWYTVFRIQTDGLDDLDEESGDGDE